MSGRVATGGGEGGMYGPGSDDQFCLILTFGPIKLP
jgi:hypothetical protein